jgi:hypothetical protein
MTAILTTKLFAAAVVDHHQLVFGKQTHPDDFAGIRSKLWYRAQRQ